MSNFMKSHPEGAELFHPDRRTHIRTVKTNPAIAYRNFTNASENEIIKSTTTTTTTTTNLLVFTVRQQSSEGIHKLFRKPRKDLKILNASEVT